MIAKKETVGTQVNRLREEKLLSSDEMNREIIRLKDENPDWKYMPDVCNLIHTLKCCEDYAKAFEAEKEKNRWISVEERLPEENIDVFISSGNTKRIMTDYLLNGKFKCYGESVKYWMIQNITPPEGE